MASKYDVGFVTAWQEVDLAYVRAVMEFDVPVMQTAGEFCPSTPFTTSCSQSFHQTDSSFLFPLFGYPLFMQAFSLPTNN